VIDRKRLREQIKGDSKLAGAIRQQVTYDHHAGEGDLQVVPLDRVRTNPDNPRKLPISREQVVQVREDAMRRTGAASVDDAFFEAVQGIAALMLSPERESIERIALLAESIYRRGLIQPITVFADEDGGATIMAGERRFLAHVLLGRPTVRALVRLRDASDLQDRAGALIENIMREDLSTAEKIESIASLAALHEKTVGTPITADELHELIHESRRTCQRYLHFLAAPPKIRALIANGKLETVRDIEAALKKMQKDEAAPKNARGRPRSAVSLGSVKTTNVVREVMEGWLRGRNKALEDRDIDWSDIGQVQAAWVAFIDLVKASLKEEAGDGRN